MLDHDLKLTRMRVTLNLKFDYSHYQVTTSIQFRDALRQVAASHARPGESLGSFVTRHVQPFLTPNEAGYYSQHSIRRDAQAQGYGSVQNMIESILCKSFPELDPYRWPNLRQKIMAERDRRRQEQLERERQIRSQRKAATGHASIIYDFPPPTRRCVRPAMSAGECEMLLRVLAKARTQHKWIESVCLSIETELDKIPGYYSGGGADQANGQAAGQSDACEGGEDAVH